MSAIGTSSSKTTSVSNSEDSFENHTSGQETLPGNDNVVTNSAASQQIALMTPNSQELDRLKMLDQNALSPTRVSSEDGLPDEGYMEPNRILALETSNIYPTGIDLLSAVNEVGSDLAFDLDPLDWNMLESAFSTQLDCNIGTEDFSNLQDISPEIFTPDSQSLNSEQDDGQHVPLPPGMCLLQISPLEAHRHGILRYLRSLGQCTRKREEWLCLDNMSRFLKSYFSCFHQHTPLLHLPFWSITTTSTRLLFPMILMGAMYSGDLEQNGRESRGLCKVAESFAWDSDQQLKDGGLAKLETIQAVYLIALLDSFFLSSYSRQKMFDISRVIGEARRLGLFEEAKPHLEPWKMGWKEWSVQECRNR